MKGTFSPLAADDLQTIGDYISADNPSRALTFVRELRQRCDRLLSAPERGRRRDDIHPGLRSLVHGNYLLFYTVSATEIRIERILHGARDLQTTFGSED